MFGLPRARVAAELLHPGPRMSRASTDSNSPASTVAWGLRHLGTIRRFSSPRPGIIFDSWPEVQHFQPCERRVGSCSAAVRRGSRVSGVAASDARDVTDPDRTALESFAQSRRESHQERGARLRDPPPRSLPGADRAADLERRSNGPTEDPQEDVPGSPTTGKVR